MRIKVHVHISEKVERQTDQETVCERDVGEGEKVARTCTLYGHETYQLVYSSPVEWG